MIHIELDTPALIVCGLTLLAFLPQLHLLFIFMVMDFIELINRFLHKLLRF